VGAPGHARAQRGAWPAAWQGQGSTGMQKLKNAVLYAALAYSTYQVLSRCGLCGAAFCGAPGPAALGTG